MPDRRLHRGPHPEDAHLFAPGQWAALQGACADLAWLLSRGYALNSGLKIVGDRYALTQRQRVAVMRATCSDQSLNHRQALQITAEQAQGQPLWLDGYNVITTLESALAHAVLLRCRDGCIRDMASMHGHYKRVAETAAAINLVGLYTSAILQTPAIHWLLDSPVSNSGRLKTIIYQIAAAAGWAWTVELVTDPDPILAKSQNIIATADSVILDKRASALNTSPSPTTHQWFNLTGAIISWAIPEAVIVALDQ